MDLEKLHKSVEKHQIIKYKHLLLTISAENFSRYFLDKLLKHNGNLHDIKN